MSKKNKTHIAIVEDDKRLAKLTCEFLVHNDYEVTLIERGDTAVNLLAKIEVDLVILDLMLPGLDGLEVCKKLRSFYSGPILLLTAKDSDFDQVLGLEMGADDYVIKPVEPHVLLARIRALLRRCVKLKDKIKSVEKLTFDKLVIDRQSQMVCFDNNVVTLTSREFQLLWILASSAGQIVSRDEIFTHTRGLDYDGLDRTVDVRISKLRKKLGDVSEKPQRIKTVWGKGYLFVASAWGDN